VIKGIGSADLILVTGASGFIGTHLIDRLCKEGHRVRLLVHQNSPAATTGRIEIRQADLRDSAAIHDAFVDSKIVIHLGGMASVEGAQITPTEAFQVNTVGTQNILEAARTTGVGRIVLLSTANVYGAPAKLPVTEDCLPVPLSIYAATKLAADVVGLSYYRCFDLPVTILRPFNVYGPGQVKNALIPTIVSQAVTGGPIRVRNAAVWRDFVFVTDVVDALIAASVKLSAIGQIFILASGQPVSVGSLVDQTAAIAGIRQEIMATSRDDGADCLFGNAAKANELLGWRAVTELRSGLERTFEWWRGMTAACSADGAG
jgi:nucleoside-diphosphate-sugar epimerase